jgi:hypothetical protein
LLPAKFVSVGTYARTGHCRSTESSFNLGHVIDCDDPAHPAATVFGAPTYGLTEGCLLCGRVVECGHDL